MGRRRSSRPAPTDSRRRGSTRFWVLSILAGCVTAAILLLPLSRGGAREAARRTQCGDHLREIGLALRAYVDVHGSLPPLAPVDADGRPGGSWREALLPYLDDAAKAAPAGGAPEVFHCPSAGVPAGMTTYHLVVSPDGLVQRDGVTSAETLAAAAPDTLLVLDVPAEFAVPWASPLDAALEALLSGRRGRHPGILMGLFADGHVAAIGLDALSPEARRALVTPQADSPPESGD